MANLFGYPIIVLPEEEEGGGNGSSNTAEHSRSDTQPDGEAASLSSGLPQSETNPYPRISESGSDPMDSQSDPRDDSFIDFFVIESNEVVGELGRDQMQRVARDDVVMVEEEIELGLGIGPGETGSGRDSVNGGDKETGSGRVEVYGSNTPIGADLSLFEDFLFCDEEDMLTPDELLQWDNSQNDVASELEPVQAPLVVEEEEEEGEGDELVLPSRTGLDQNTENTFLMDYLIEQSVDEIMMNAIEGSSLMDLDLDDDLLQTFFPPGPGENHGIYSHPPLPPIMGTRPASKRVVDDLPVVEITSEELSGGKIVCAVCIGDVAVGEKVTTLPCCHYYHGECIVPWLGVKNTCPVCRFELPTDCL